MSQEEKTWGHFPSCQGRWIQNKLFYSSNHKKEHIKPLLQHNGIFKVIFLWGTTLLLQESYKVRNRIYQQFMRIIMDTALLVILCWFSRISGSANHKEYDILGAVKESSLCDSRVLHKMYQILLTYMWCPRDLDLCLPPQAQTLLWLKVFMGSLFFDRSASSSVITLGILVQIGRFLSPLLFSFAGWNLEEGIGPLCPIRNSLCLCPPNFQDCNISCYCCFPLLDI